MRVCCTVVLSVAHHPPQITGSLARAVIKELAAKNVIKPVALHSHFVAYTKA